VDHQLFPCHIFHSCHDTHTCHDTYHDTHTHTLKHTHTHTHATTHATTHTPFMQHHKSKAGQKQRAKKGGHHRSGKCPGCVFTPSAAGTGKIKTTSTIKVSSHKMQQ